MTLRPTAVRTLLTMRCAALLTIAFGFGVVLLAGCKRDTEQPAGEAPPPVATQSANICETGKAPVLDAELSASVQPRISTFCLDPNDVPRSYGEGSASTLGQVCTELFNGDCELYKGFGLNRVSSLRYVDGAGTPASVTVNLSRFGAEEGAYAFFTHRVLGDGNPLDLSTRPLLLQGQAALGGGFALLRRGKLVAELTYSSDVETPDQMRRRADAELPQFLRSFAERFRGDAELPEPAKSLPQEHRLPLGVRFYHRNALDIDGAGRAAVGYYKHDEQGYCVLFGQQPDEDSAKDVEVTLRQQPGAKRLEDMPYDAFELVRGAADAHAVWLFGRVGTKIVGVGDAPFLLRDATNPEQRAKVSLSRTDKVRLMRSVFQATR